MPQVWNNRSSTRKLLTEGVTHAITSGLNVGEGHARGGLGNLLSGAFDLNRGDLDVLIKAHGAIAREDQVHVQDEWNLSFVVTAQGSNCNSLLGQLEIWPSITVESETAIRVDIDGELRDILLLLTCVGPEQCLMLVFRNAARGKP